MITTSLATFHLKHLRLAYKTIKTLLAVLALLIITSNIALAQISNSTTKQPTCLNGNTIGLGDSMTTVEKACGEPDNTQSKSTPITEDQTVQHWYYLALFNTDSNNNVDQSNQHDGQSNQENQENQGLILRIVIQFDQQNKVYKLHVYRANNQVTADDIDLLAYAIKLGDTKSQVTSILGAPFDTKAFMKPVTVGKTTTNTWQYSISKNNPKEDNSTDDNSTENNSIDDNSVEKNSTKKQVLIFTDNKLTAVH